MERHLYGGAICVNIPASYLDASQLRQIPDNQEVFVEGDSDKSIVIELLEPAEGNEPARWHYQQLAEDNEAHSAAVSSIQTLSPTADTPRLPPMTRATLLTGIQTVSKFNQTTPATVSVLLAVVHLSQAKTDVVITLNRPLVEGVSEGIEHMAAASALQEMKLLLQSLEVKDWSLFAG
ncbi:hypothetical protein BDK51DRAFT_18003 [Blyttiomyces helicus]|uniref:Mog1p/PsbP-like protein n=1 Tax=Blyttiomyces helicus TaxID=388810 RepID=A0A4P9W391_9FUNG|nr:hypothetical protein BDK51DRAFT_18003 [Blyttiomyces helicus]|eukprot:RKO86771.1 hypothetical protein BDK51DRAFT_18003 [Blyttiomyces helicus]